MRLKRNDSGLPDAEVRKLLACAAHGVRDVGIRVSLKADARPGVSVWGSQSPEPQLRILIREPDENPFYAQSPLWVSNWIAARFPGLTTETLQDQIVWLAAKGFSGIKQWRVVDMDTDFQRRGVRRKNEWDRFAFRRLNDWRVATGRQSVPETRGVDNGALGAYNAERERRARQRSLKRRVAASPFPLGRFLTLGAQA